MEATDDWRLEEVVAILTGSESLRCCKSGIVGRSKNRPRDIVPLVVLIGLVNLPLQTHERKSGYFGHMKYRP